MHQLGVDQKQFLAKKKYWVNVCKEDLKKRFVAKVQQRMINRKCIKYLRNTYHTSLNDLAKDRTMWLAKCKDAGIRRYAD